MAAAYNHPIRFYVSPTDLYRLKRMLAAGISTHKISDRLGISRTKIMSTIKLEGLTPPVNKHKAKDYYIYSNDTLLHKIKGMRNCAAKAGISITLIKSIIDTGRIIGTREHGFEITTYVK